jgi:hypothetical protein
MKKITPLLKGLIAGIAMVGLNLLLIRFNSAGNSQYFFYLLYAGAIAWTLIDFSKSENYVANFGSIFGQGFRCFIIITLVTVVFVGIYSSRLDTDKFGEEIRKELIKENEQSIKLGKGPKRLPEEIEKEVSNFKKHFVTSNISLATFSTLITGAIFTAVGAGILLMRKK